MNEESIDRWISFHNWQYLVFCCNFYCRKQFGFRLVRSPWKIFNNSVRNGTDVCLWNIYFFRPCRYSYYGNRIVQESQVIRLSFKTEDTQYFTVVNKGVPSICQKNHTLTIFARLDLMHFPVANGSGKSTTWETSGDEKISSI